jgi:hypothetical protein
MVAKKALAGGRPPKRFRCEVLSKAFQFRVEQGLAAGEGLEAFKKVKPSEQMPTFNQDRRAQRAQAALQDAVAAYLAEVLPVFVEEAKKAFQETAKGSLLHPLVPIPTTETWRAFLDALKASYEAGVDASASIVGAGAIGNAAAIYAQTRAGYLIGRSWSDELGQWVQVPDSPFRITETMRNEFRGILETATKDGWSLGDLTAELSARYPDSFPQDRALRIARTETGDAYNTGNLVNQATQGVEVVEVMDGHGAGSCDACDAVDGEIWTLTYALAHTLEHPNCARSFQPRPDLTVSDAVH